VNLSTVADKKRKWQSEGGTLLLSLQLSAISAIPTSAKQVMLAGNKSPMLRDQSSADLAQSAQKSNGSVDIHAGGRDSPQPVWDFSR
jgi:hypothetical protein